VIVSSSAQLSRVRAQPGVLRVAAVTDRVASVRAVPSDRDRAMESLRALRPPVVVHHAYRPRGTRGTVYYITDRILLRIDPGAPPGRVDALLASRGLRVLKEYDPSAFLVEVTRSSGANPVKVANVLAQEPIVLSAEPNMVNRFRPAFVPRDTLFPRQWHLHARTGPQLLAEASVHAPEAWDVTRGERSVVVAVIDDGFDLDHPDFVGPKKIVNPRDYVDGDARPFPSGDLHDFHGTPCAGVAIAEMNGRGVVGVAAGCAFMPVRMPMAADDDLLLEVLGEVGRHADVISCSWGPPPVFAPLASEVSRLLDTLAAGGGPGGRGCVICVAAGNYDAPINDPVNAKGFEWLDPDRGELLTTSGRILNGLAAHPSVMAVGASTSQNRHAAYSNWGAELSVCAPSSNFHPRDPGAFVPGRPVWTTDNERHGEGYTARSAWTGRFGGTSSAAPLAAGIAALVRSANPALTAAEVRDVIERTADRIVDPGKDARTGRARGRYVRGRSEWFGHGKVNAARAVAEAVRRRAAGHAG
jgi:subtilisin family serine protease